MQLEKNLKFKQLCKGTVYFQPYATHSNVLLSGVYDKSGSYMRTSIQDIQPIVAYNPYDIVLLGGQSAGYITGWSGTDISLTMPYGTYELEDNDIGSFGSVGTMEKAYDTAYFFKPYYASGNVDAAFSYDGSSVGSSYVETDVSTIIAGAEILEYIMDRDQGLYGNHRLVYSTNNSYKIKLAMPYKTPVEKMNQLLSADVLAFQVDQRDTTNYTNDSNYVFKKPLGGGNVSPLIRKLSLDKKTLRAVINRNRYEIDAYLEG